MGIGQALVRAEIDRLKANVTSELSAVERLAEGAGYVELGAMVNNDFAGGYGAYYHHIAKDLSIFAKGSAGTSLATKAFVGEAMAGLRWAF